MLRFSCVTLAVMAGVLLSSPAQAVTDPTGDFLPGFTGPRAADLDISFAQVFLGNGGISFLSTHETTPGLTPGSSVTWGIDRGAGVAGLFAGDPPVGPNVLFDAVLSIVPRGPVTLTVFNAAGPPTVTLLDDRAASIDTLLIGFVPYDLLPSRGLALADYSFNAWSRSGPGNAGIADLARDAGNFGAVPEPSSWAMLIAGFGMIGAVARRRSRAAVAG